MLRRQKGQKRNLYGLKKILANAAPVEPRTTTWIDGSRSKCPYCGAEMKLVEARPYYTEGGLQTQAYKCSNPDCACGASVSQNGLGEDQPWGAPCDKKLSSLRKETHFYVDQLWKGGYMTRDNAYRLLQMKLNLPEAEAHIRLFNTWSCEKAITIAINEMYTNREHFGGKVRLFQGKREKKQTGRKEYLSKMLQALMDSDGGGAQMAAPV